MGIHHQALLSPLRHTESGNRADRSRYRTQNSERDLCGEIGLEEKEEALPRSEMAFPQNPKQIGIQAKAFKGKTKKSESLLSIG